MNGHSFQVTVRSFVIHKTAVSADQACQFRLGIDRIILNFCGKRERMKRLFGKIFCVAT